MNSRLERIFSVLTECDVFADVGCDHGYMAKAMLDSGKCKRVIISDVSEKCLKKAQDLLADYAKSGRVTSVVSDGFEKVGPCDLALIAGMGGEEIISIIEKAKSLPERLVVQPMKNTDRVRVAVIKAGYAVEKDFTFICQGKYYDLISLKKGKDSLTREEIEFGRTNINEPTEDFKKIISDKISKLREYLESDTMSDKTKQDMISEIEKLSKYV